MPNTLLQGLSKAFRQRDRRTGYTWAVIIAWFDFAFLYWAVWTDNPVLIGIGLIFMALACGIAVYFG